MPLPMIHLAVAVRLGETHPQCLTPDFLLGSLAPDAIHMRPRNTNADKSATHLVAPGSRFTDEAAVYALVQQHMTTCTASSAFIIGYATHILTDNLWKRTVTDQFYRQAPDDLDHATLRTLYYLDADQIDFNLYYRAAWRPVVWQKLAAAEAPDFPPLLSGDEIDGWRSRTLRWFTELKEEPGIEPAYITGTTINKFIDSAALLLAEQFEQWHLQERLI